MSTYRVFDNHFLKACLAAVFAIGLTACSSSSDNGATMTPDPEPTQTAYETATAAIAAAETADAAQAAYDAVKDDVTAAEGDMLQMKVDERIAAIQMAARVADQRMALMGAAGMIDTSDLSTAEAIAAANRAIASLQTALDMAADLSDADKAMYQTQLDNAKDAVAMAQTGLDTAGRMTAQRMAITDAVATARTAVNMVDDDATDAEVMAADNAIATLKAAIDGAADLPEGDTDVASAQGTLTTLEGQLSAAKTSRTAAMNKADRDKAAMMAATAAKLYAGIDAPAGDVGSPTLTDRAAAYNTDATAILVSPGGPTGATPSVITLSEDKKTTVAANRGWAGKRYADPAGGDMYEAYVYSNVEAPKQGRKFGSAADVTEAGAYEYHLDAADRDGNADKALTIVNTDHAARISLTGVTRTAGTETFKLPENNPAGERFISVPGMLHGVSGTFSCAPAIATDGCTAAVAAKGFTLAGGTWLFIPSNANARVTDAKDDAYASYGWWLKKTANDATYTASAFVDRKGADPTALAIADLRGTATYRGGAAGQYALASSTGGTNDAGHFTARATLEAKFGDDHSITGTIDQFVGADGESRDWSVALMNSTISDTGGIAGDPATAANTDAQMTQWTIGGGDAVAAGQWSGDLAEAGDDGVPKVATGTFYSTYGTAGKMVGAFGANKQ